MNQKKIVVVGGVAGGASCAARCRRLDENARIIMIDRGPYVSFANCGLPYYVGDVITDESRLLVANAALFQDRFNIEVRTQHEVIAIDRATREIEVKELSTGRIYRESYDALVLSPGAAAVRPPIPGIDLPGIFVLRSIPDSRRIRAWITEKHAKSAVIVGAGFIGLEMAENLKHRGLSVTVVEMLDQVMPPFDPEMARPVQEHMEKHGVKMALGDGVAGFEADDGGRIVVRTKSGAAHAGDLVILAIGVRPETGLAKSAGLELGDRGGIRVDEQMRTSDPNIWAAGDAVEVKDIVTGQWTMIPLAGPANRQGRVAADAICGRGTKFRGVQATAICGVFGLAVASTGASEKSLKRAGVTDYEKVYLHPGHHVSYFPGAKPINLKLIYRKQDGRILGAQAVGEADVDKRIDVIATAIQFGGTVFDLEELELCYAPQFGGAKDPVNYAGMIAANNLRGDLPLADWKQLGAASAVLVDVREPDEYNAGHVPGAMNLPLNQVRHRLGELPRDREVWLYCGVGQRAYYATRVLVQNGFHVKNLPGGYRTYGYLNQEAAANGLAHRLLASL
ncbi:MAG TPA: FAD-dependent oxidoreductase [Chthoniobacteraceae bacterium]|jgi:NADPH-dependent 2,4-dienoyl-CoA reductase/sulfur reductase-like enzyme/rhodanese-related sulfurtransferase|nr:FAD-dependent oxidoreductase [Chthoniobacteraceae bacterium]